MKHRYVLLLLAGSLCCALSLSAEETTIGTIRVDLDNELQSLAQGYTAAFAAMPTGPKYIRVRGDDGPVYLEGSVAGVEAFEGVLLIRIERGPVIVVNARDVIRMTNTRP
jgi:hypothetical protein